MNKPEEYSKSNGISIYTVTLCLEEYIGKIKFKEVGETAIDLGCADGSVTCLLKEYLPQNCSLFACDVNENMLEFAKNHHADKNITFKLQDVEGVLADDLRGRFNHVFSFFLFHWIQKQEIAFQNVYNMLTEGGKCFHIFFSDMPLYDIYEILRHRSKWNTLIHGNASKFFSPYYKMQGPKKRVVEIMESTGFINVNVQIKKMSYPIENLIVFKNLIKAVQPLEMPEEVFEDFYVDILAVARDIGLVDKTIAKDDTVKQIIIEYNLIIATASKP